jgi:hypothetical protein
VRNTVGEVVEQAVSKVATVNTKVSWTRISEGSKQRIDRLPTLVIACHDLETINRNCRHRLVELQ